MRTPRLLAVIEAETITGPAKNLLQFAQLARGRMDVTLVVFQRGGRSSLFQEAARGLSIPIYVIPEAGRFDRAVVGRLATLVRELKPDVVQTHAVKSHFFARLGGVGNLAPWIAFHHGYTWPEWWVRIYNQLDRWSLRTPRRIVTVSRPFAEELSHIGVPAGRITIVHNAIDPAWGSRAKELAAASALRARLGIGTEKKVALIVGRLSPEKDHQTLLEAIAELRNRGVEDTHLVVVGDGPERAAIESSVTRLGLSDQVTLTGQTDSAEPYYGIADVCVLSSLSEGSPNALLEAMAARVPVVATAVGGIPEIVSHSESALLIQPRDRAAMSQAIGQLLTDEGMARRLAAAASQRVLERHTPESRLNQLMEIYSSVLENSRLC
jgi:glycosyltransferase involved in cell wall biosynthesis